MTHRIWFAFSVMSLFFLGHLPGARAADRVTIGYIENILLYPGAMPFQVKIDTGAKTSSIDVREISEFERDNSQWVRFTIANNEGRTATLERPVFRTVKVRRADTAKQTRLVVKLGICLGGYFKNAQVNLNKRAAMSYRMLIGRSFLADKFFIDSSAKKLTSPDCPEAPRK